MNVYIKLDYFIIVQIHKKVLDIIKAMIMVDAKPKPWFLT